MKVFRRLAAVVALVLGVSVLAALPGGAQNIVTVKVGDNYYRPSKVTLTAGDKITFRWVGSAVHDVVVKKGPKKFKSKKQVQGKYSKVLVDPGKYQIYCTLHPGMTLKLTVKPAPVTTTLPPPPPAT